MSTKDELIGPDLALTVARVIGHTHERIARDGTRFALRDTGPFPEATLRDTPEDNCYGLKPFRPDLGGADAWEVLEWLISTRGWHETIRIWQRAREHDSEAVLTPAEWLCRAVVALERKA